MLFDNEALQALKQKFEEGKVKKEGVVKSTDRGFGFLECSDRESYFIPPRYMRNVLHGDRVVAVIEPGERDKKEQAIPEKLVESALDRFVAQVKTVDGRLRVVSDDVNIKIEINAEDARGDKSIALEDGDYVVCRLKTHALQDKHFKARITEFVAKKDDPKVPWTVSLRALDLPLEPPHADPGSLKYKDDFEHQDLTSIPFVTIDSEKTKDMDDALYASMEGDVFVLYVAIADPTAYIYPGDPLDKVAARNAFSIYLPGRDIPMLPRELSDDLCSLKEGEIRSSLVARLEVAKDGEILFDRTKFMLAKIKSYRRLVYNQVSDFLEQGTRSEGFDPDQTVEDNLRCLLEFAKARDQYRQTHGAAFRNRPDYDFVLNDDGALDHIEVNYRRSANQIVEECMISANLAAGYVLANNYHGGVFNLHEGFDLKHKSEVVSLLSSLGCEEGDESPYSTIQGFSAVRRLANSKESPYFDCRIRKLQQFSKISSKPGPHFALGVENYATFTSPIRKFGDMVNHRLLKALTTGHTEQAKLPSDDMIEHMNIARRLNRTVERDVKDWLYVDYLKGDLEKHTVFKAEVFDISRSGMRLIMVDNGAIGFLPASMIGADKHLFELNANTGELLVNNQVKLRLGDIIEVKISSLNRDTRSIVLSLVHGIEGLPLPPAQEAGSPS